MIITVAHQKGGVGKSTLVTNLCGYLKTDLLDMDKQFSSTAWNALRIENEKPGIKVYTIKEQNCKVPYQTPVSIRDIWKLLLREYKGNPDKHIMIDCPGFESNAMITAIWLADYILTPVGPSLVEVYGLDVFEKNVISKSEKLDNPPRRIRAHVVINNNDNRSKKRTNELRDYLNQNPHFIVCQSTISRNMAFIDAYSEGKTVTEFRPRGSSAELKLLADEIMKELGL